jgi:hypothetical protein
MRRVGCSLFETDPTRRPRVTRTTALVAEENDAALVGFVILRGGVEIEHIYTAPESHGTGIGKQLLLAAEDVMYNERGSELAHLTCSVRNLRAQRFYEKYGWVATGRQAWMTTSPWQRFRPPELPLPERLRAQGMRLDERGGLTEDEVEATRMRCTMFKKILGYQQETVVPRIY